MLVFIFTMMSDVWQYIVEVSYPVACGCGVFSVVAGSRLH
jgi:hypothetical protein